MNGKGQPGSLAGETRDNGKLTEQLRNPVTTTKWKVIAPWPGAPGHHSPRQKEARKKLCLPHEPDPVGTRRPASGLGFRCGRTAARPYRSICPQLQGSSKEGPHGSHVSSTRQCGQSLASDLDGDDVPTDRCPARYQAPGVHSVWELKWRWPLELP